MPVYEHHSDEQLAQAARDEDLGAWEAFLRRHGQRLLAFFTRMGGDEEQARELWVRCWSELWSLRGSLAAASRPSTALFALAYRLSQAGPNRPAQRAVPGDPSSLEHRSARLLNSLQALPLRQRAALCLCYFDNLPFDEAGRCLACGAGEAKQLCAEAYAGLSDQLGPGFLGEGLA